ncbi:hypothetical protein ACFFRR_001090 [Megaselia abdita]
MRDYIFNCKKNLKDSKVIIYVDCPKEIMTMRKQLLPALLRAKKMKKRAFFKYGTLLVNRAVCSHEDIVKYSKAYLESKNKRPAKDVISPEKETNDAKKSKNVSVDRRPVKNRSQSVSNLQSLKQQFQAHQMRKHSLFSQKNNNHSNRNQIKPPSLETDLKMCLTILKD